ncbi:MAG: TonB-dependent receptor [Proteobacteria bacterium]|nr:TonB-dependent receptor [Pseudomonadota bacterium]
MPASSTPRFALRAVALAAAAASLATHALAQDSTPATSAGTLSAITVEASADASAAGLAKPFAGGQVARGGRVGILGTQDNMSTPFSSTSYTNELIQNQQAQSVADVLLNDPTVRQARGFGNFQELYVLRGFPVFSDDIVYNGLYGMLPRQYIASEFFERVEVFRGANTFLNGSAPGGTNIGGSINLLPKRAPNDPLTSISAGVQSGGEGYLAADIARRFGPDQSTGIRLNAVRRDGGTGVDDESRELSALSLGVDWHNRNVRLSADIGWQDHDLKQGRPSVTPAAGIALPSAPDSDKNWAQPWTYSKERDTFGTLRGEVDITDNITAWAAAGARRGTESNSVANPTVLNAAGDTTAFRFDNVRKDEIATGEVGARFKFNTGSVGHTLTTAASTYSSKERDAFAFSGFFAGNLYNPVAIAPPPVFTTGSFSDPQVTLRNKFKSVAVADAISFLDDRLIATVGLRRQSIEQDSFDYVTGAPTTSYESARNTPMAGLLFKLNKQVSLYGNYMEALIPGQAAPTSTASGPVANAGEVFAPFRSKQKEIGLKYDGGTIGASVAAFSIEQPQYFVQNNVYGPNGEQRNQGLEFSVFGEPVKGVRVLGGLSLMNPEQRRTAGGLTDGKDAIGIPSTQVNLGGEFDIPGVQGLAVNALWLYTGKQYADAANTQALDSWNRVDIGARYLMDIGSGRLLTLRAKVSNVFDKSYWASAGGYPGSNYLVMGAPRTFGLSATVDF